MKVRSQIGKLDNTEHKVLPLGQPEIGGNADVAWYTEQKVSAGANPRRGRNGAYRACEHTDGATEGTGVKERKVVDTVGAGH